MLQPSFDAQGWFVGVGVRVGVFVDLGIHILLKQTYPVLHFGVVAQQSSPAPPQEGVGVAGHFLQQYGRRLPHAPVPQFSPAAQAESLQKPPLETHGYGVDVGLGVGVGHFLQQYGKLAAHVPVPQSYPASQGTSLQ